MTFERTVGPLLAPIAGPSVAGVDLRTDPRHEAIRAEVAKLDSPSGGEVDWASVVENGSTLLASGSKDLLIACYVAFALLDRDGVRGLAGGVWMVAELLDRYWDDLFPGVARIRGRANAVDWLVRRAAVALETPPATDGASVASLAEAVDRLAAVLSKRFPEPPAIGPLRDQLTRLRLDHPVAASAPAAPAALEHAPAAPTPSPEPEHASDALAPQASADAAPSASAAPEQALSPSPPEPPSDFAEPSVAALLVPIPGDAPAGADAKYDAEHQAVRTEIATLDSPTGGAIDWARIAKTCENILERRSKDLLIASFWAAAAFELKGLDGLADGVRLVAELGDRYWEDAFPPKSRERARANGVAWLLARAERVAEMQPSEKDRPAIERLDRAASRLSEVVRARFEAQPPAVRPLLDAVARLKLSVPAPASAPVPAPAAPTPVGQQPASASGAPKDASAATRAPAVAAPPAATVGAPQTAAVALPPPAAAKLADPSQVTEFARQIGSSLIEGARQVFKASTADPNAFRLHRIGLYLHIAGPPPVQSAVKTSVPAPSPELSGRLEAMQRSQNWAALLEEAETSLPRQRFWLDLHRYVTVALDGLGPSHAEAKKAVEQGVGELLGRMPSLVDLQFDNGEPFASGATRDWIERQVLPSGATPGASAADAAEEAAIDEARALASKGKPDEALAELERLALTLPTAEQRFRARLAAAQICASNGHPFVAEGLYRHLISLVDHHDLEAWSPALAQTCYVEYHRTLAALAKAGRAMPAEQSMVYCRLSRVAPSVAMKMPT